MKSNKMMVSIFCLAYNHEPYIRKCLEGFIIQKTNFKYEVLIHDDASTDRTAEIIREYEVKYPDIIKPIYQIENQYSKGISINRVFQYPRASGKYIAYCEGDDYWTDEFKLQKQVDFLENNPDYSICVHQATLHNCRTEVDSAVTNQFEDKDYSLEEILIAGGGVFATNSIMILKSIRENMPECFKAKGFGDYQLYIYGAIVGKCKYLSDNMSVYNFQTQGSWSSKMNNNRQFHIDHFRELIRMLKKVNVYYNLKYDEIFSKAILNAEYQMYVYMGKFLKVHKKIYRSCYLHSLDNGISPYKTYLIYRFPKLYDFYANIKERFSDGKK